MRLAERRSSRALLGLAVVALALTACDEAPRPSDADARPLARLAPGEHVFPARNATTVDLAARPKAQTTGPREALEVRAPAPGRAAHHAYWSYWLTLAPGSAARVESAWLETVRLPPAQRLRSDPLAFALSIPARDGVWDAPGGLAFDDATAWALRVSDADGVLMDAAHPPDPSNEEWKLIGGDWGPVQEWSVTAEREAGPLRTVEWHVARRSKAGARDVGVFVRITDPSGAEVARSEVKAWAQVDASGFDGTHDFQSWSFEGSFTPKRGVRYLAWLDHDGWSDEDEPVLAPRAWVLKRGRGPTRHSHRGASWSRRPGIGRGRYLFQRQIPRAIGSGLVAVEVDAETNRFDVAKLVREWVDSEAYAKAWRAGGGSGAVFVVRFAPAAGALGVSHRFAPAADLRLRLR